MYNLIYKSLWGFVFFFIFYLNYTVAASGPSHGKVVVCYLSSWSVYRPSKGAFSLENLNPSLCTHLVYSFAGLDVTNDSVKSLDPWQDLPNNYGKDGYARAIKLKETYPHLKVTIGFGGWNEGSANYSRLAADASRRQKLVASAVEFVKKHKFDGMDLHWKYPAERGGAPEDKQNLVMLVKELRQAFNLENLLLTAAFGAIKDTMDRAYDVAELSKYLDYVHLMCFDYHGPWEGKIVVNAPLRSNDVYNIEFSVNYMIEMGMDPSKLIMGVPLFGRTFYLINELTSNSNPLLGSPAKNTGFKGPYTLENDFMGYNEICVELQNPSWNKFWDAESKTPSAVNGDKVIIYDNEKSITEKVKFAIQKKLGGIMVWSIDTDDFLGECHGQKYPLMRTINRAIIQNKKDNQISTDDNKKPQDKNKFPLIEIFP